MKKFIIHFLLFFLMVITIVVSISLVKKDRYWSTRVPVIKSRLNFSAFKDPIIVLGASHTLNGINSKYIAENCFNMSSASQGYVEDFHILKSISQTSKVGMVILPFSLFSNHFYIDKSIIDGEYMRIFDYEKSYQVKYTFNYKYLKYKLSLLKEFVNLDTTYLLSKKDFDEMGNLLQDCKQKQFSLSDSLTAFIRHTRNMDFSSRHPYLDSIINLCEQKKISLKLVVLPFSSGYRNLIRRNCPEYNTFVQRLAEEANSRYQVLDYRDYFKNNEQIYFKDADHLSPCGRDTFSVYLRKQLFNLTDSAEVKY